MPSSMIRPADAAAPFKVVRVAAILDAHDAVSGERRERAATAPDLVAAQADLWRLNAEDGDAIADGMLRYEIRDARDRPVRICAEPRLEECPF